MQKLSTRFLLLLFTVGLLSACTKDDDLAPVNEIDADVQSAEQVRVTQNALQNLISTTLEIALNNEEFSGIPRTNSNNNSCVTVTTGYSSYYQASYLIVNFDGQCNLQNGATASGTIALVCPVNLYNCGPTQPCQLYLYGVTVNGCTLDVHTPPNEPLRLWRVPSSNSFRYVLGAKQGTQIEVYNPTNTMVTDFTVPYLEDNATFLSMELTGINFISVVNLAQATYHVDLGCPSHPYWEADVYDYHAATQQRTFVRDFRVEVADNDPLEIQLYNDGPGNSLIPCSAYPIDGTMLLKQKQAPYFLTKTYQFGADAHGVNNGDCDYYAEVCTYPANATSGTAPDQCAVLLMD